MGSRLAVIDDNNTLEGLSFSHHLLCLFFTLHRIFAWRYKSCYSEVEQHEFDEQHRLYRPTSERFALDVPDILFCDRRLRHLREWASMCSIRHEQAPQDSDQLLRCFSGGVRYFGRQHQYSDVYVHPERVSENTYYL